MPRDLSISDYPGRKNCQVIAAIDIKHGVSQVVRVKSLGDSPGLSRAGIAVNHQQQRIVRRCRGTFAYSRNDFVSRHVGLERSLVRAKGVLKLSKSLRVLKLVEANVDGWREMD
jgi:hypothetical protein